MATNPVLAGIQGFATLAEMGLGIANILKKKPKIYGAPGSMRVSQAQMQNIADRLASGEGLSETQYNRLMEGASEQAKTGTQQAAIYTRENPFLSTAASERIASELFNKSQAIMQKATTDALIADINAAEQNLEKSQEAYAKSAAIAADIKKIDEEARQLREARNVAQAENFIKLVTGASSAIGNIVDSTSGFKSKKEKPDEFADYWKNKDNIQVAEELGTSVGTTKDVATEATQPIKTDKIDRFNQMQEMLYPNGETDFTNKANRFAKIQEMLYPNGETDVSNEMNRRYKPFETIVSEVESNIAGAKVYAEKTLGSSQKYATFDEIISDADRRIAGEKISPEEQYQISQINKLRSGMVPGSYEDKELNNNYNFLKELGYSGKELEDMLNLVVK